MQFLKDNKIYIAGVVAVAALLWIYFMYFSGSSSAPTLTSDQTDSPISQDILVTLSNLHTIRLNDAIFSDPVFTSLTDYGVAIPAQNAGRPNPFSSPSRRAGGRTGTYDMDLLKLLVTNGTIDAAPRGRAQSRYRKTRATRPKASLPRPVSRSTLSLR